MWKYVSRRVKDTIELSINVRKSFTIQQSLNNSPQQQQQQNDRKQNQHRLYSTVAPRHQDPSRDKDKSDEKFKKKYHRLNNNNKCFLNALTWSTAIITGFYGSQLLCLYRRQRLGLDASRCYYSKYVQKTSQSIHKNVKYLLTPAGQSSLIPSLPKLECPFKRARRGESKKLSQQRIIEDEFSDFKHFVDPGYNQYERFFDAGFKNTSSTNVYNINNDKTNVTVEPSLQKDNLGKQDTSSAEETAEEKENAAIDEAIRQLAHIVGELEFQMGVDSFNDGSFNEAFDHFKLSTNHNHPGGVFNLALCYEKGVGVKRSMKTARKLYEIASQLGHAKAFYNLGVFHAQGLGGAHKSFFQAKKCFETAAELGSIDAEKALSLLLPPTKKLPVNKKFDEDDFFFTDKLVMSSPVRAIANHNMMRVAVS